MPPLKPKNVKSPPDITLMLLYKHCERANRDPTPPSPHHDKNTFCTSYSSYLKTWHKICIVYILLILTCKCGYNWARYGNKTCLSSIFRRPFRIAYIDSSTCAPFWGRHEVMLAGKPLDQILMISKSSLNTSRASLLKSTTREKMRYIIYSICHKVQRWCKI